MPPLSDLLVRTKRFSAALPKVQGVRFFPPKVRLYGTMKGGFHLDCLTPSPGALSLAPRDPYHKLSFPPIELSHSPISFARVPLTPHQQRVFKNEKSGKGGGWPSDPVFLKIYATPA